MTPDTTKALAEALEPCPFCGHVGLVFGDGSSYRWGIASCGGCGATCGEVRRSYPDDGAWRSKAIKEWNTRAHAPAAEPLTVDAVRDLIDDAGLDWHNGWTVGEDSTNRYLSLCRAVERAHGIGADSQTQPANKT